MIPAGLPKHAPISLSRECPLVESLPWLTALCMIIVIRNDRRPEMTYGSKPKMYPSVALALAALALLLLAGRAAGETAIERVERFELFGDCKPMALVVERLPPDAARIGLTVDSLQAAVESRLRAARLHDSEVLSPPPLCQRKRGRRCFWYQL